MPIFSRRFRAAFFVRALLRMVDIKWRGGNAGARSKAFSNNQLMLGTDVVFEAIQIKDV